MEELMRIVIRKNLKKYTYKEIEEAAVLMLKTLHEMKAADCND